MIIGPGSHASPALFILTTGSAPGNDPLAYGGHK
jgi:hypothetical protein